VSHVIKLRGSKSIRRKENRPKASIKSEERSPEESDISPSIASKEPSCRKRLVKKRLAAWYPATESSEESCSSNSNPDPIYDRLRHRRHRIGITGKSAITKHSAKNLDNDNTESDDNYNRMSISRPPPRSAEPGSTAPIRNFPFPHGPLGLSYDQQRPFAPLAISQFSTAPPMGPFQQNSSPLQQPLYQATPGFASQAMAPPVIHMPVMAGIPPPPPFHPPPGEAFFPPVLNSGPVQAGSNLQGTPPAAGSKTQKTAGNAVASDVSKCPKSSASSLSARQDTDDISDNIKSFAGHHFCSSCGILRSKMYHRLNKLKPGKTSLPNMCRKCRDEYKNIPAVSDLLRVSTYPC
jgi:hypothetical protein